MLNEVTFLKAMVWELENKVNVINARIKKLTPVKTARKVKPVLTPEEEYDGIMI